MAVLLGEDIANDPNITPLPNPTGDTTTSIKTGQRAGLWISVPYVSEPEEEDYGRIITVFPDIQKNTPQGTRVNAKSEFYPLSRPVTPYGCERQLSQVLNTFERSEESS